MKFIILLSGFIYVSSFPAFTFKPSGISFRRSKKSQRNSQSQNLASQLIDDSLHSLHSQSESAEILVDVADPPSDPSLAPVDYIQFNLERPRGVELIPSPSHKREEIADEENFPRAPLPLPPSPLPPPSPQICEYKLACARIKRAMSLASSTESSGHSSRTLVAGNHGSDQKYESELPTDSHHMPNRVRSISFKKSLK
jgi:hypothetical protein